MHHGSGRRTAAVMHAGKEAQVADTHISGDVDLVAGVHGEGDHAVDVAGRQAGVVERGADRLARQLQFAAPGFLGEFGLADPGDGVAPGSRLTLRPFEGSVEQAEDCGAGDVIAQAV